MNLHLLNRHLKRQRQIVCEDYPVSHRAPIFDLYGLLSRLFLKYNLPLVVQNHLLFYMEQYRTHLDHLIFHALQRQRPDDQVPQDGVHMKDLPGHPQQQLFFSHLIQLFQKMSPRFL